MRPFKQRQDRTIFNLCFIRSVPKRRLYSSRSTEPSHTNADWTTQSRFTSVYDPVHGTDWRQWFAPAEYENPWNDRRRFSSVERWTWNPAADCATKHVLSQLQSVHHFEQHVTTELCNATLRNLLDLVPTMTNNQKITNLTVEEATQTVHICERAHAILQSMELLDAQALPSQYHHQHHHHFQQRRIPRALPKPSRETYNTVLLICSKASSLNRSIPDTAMAIVQRMHDRYHIRQELDMKPISFHWNCVLLAWMHCGDTEKAVHAVQLLLRLATSADAASLVDASSYIHVLRICAYGANDKGGGGGGGGAVTAASTAAAPPPTTNAAQLGATVAVKLWQEMFEHASSSEAMGGGGMSPPPTAVHVPEPLPSHFYSHFLQAIRALPPRATLPGGNGRRLVRDTYYAKCLQRACETGKVNRFVLQDFFVHVKSKDVFDHFLGSYRKQIYGQSTDKAVSTLLQLIPSEWTAKAD